jgi:GlcNAc-P-P-Und epimerase
LNKNLDKKITVIGGAGFVGTNLCQSLADHQISFEILDIKTSKRFPDKSKISDVRDVESLRASITGNVVINLAAVHQDNIRDKKKYYDTNVIGSENITQVCEEAGISKIIFTSTVAVYGFAEPGSDENSKIKPFNEYGRTKFLAEEKLRTWQSKTDSSLVIIRPSVIFGEGNRGNVYNLLSQIASGRFIMIGNGKNKKSMVYIGNIVAFLIENIFNDEKYNVYNYVDNPDMDMNTLVETVKHTLSKKSNFDIRLPYFLGLLIGYCADGFEKVTGRKLLVSSIRVKKFCSTTVFSTSKSPLNNFNAPFCLKSGLIKTLQSEFITPDKNREIFFSE